MDSISIGLDIGSSAVRAHVPLLRRQDPDLPDATSFQVLTNSNGNVGNDNGQGYYFGGVLYAPQAQLTEDGCKSQYYGSLVINVLTYNDGPHLYVSYDSALEALNGPWTAGSYTQANAAAVARAIP